MADEFKEIVYRLRPLLKDSSSFSSHERRPVIREDLGLERNCDYERETAPVFCDRLAQEIADLQSASVLRRTLDHLSEFFVEGEKYRQLEAIRSDLEAFEVSIVRGDAPDQPDSESIHRAPQSPGVDERPLSRQKLGVGLVLLAAVLLMACLFVLQQVESVNQLASSRPFLRITLIAIAAGLAAMILLATRLLKGRFSLTAVLAAAGVVFPSLSYLLFVDRGGGADVSQDVGFVYDGRRQSVAFERLVRDRFGSLLARKGITDVRASFHDVNVQGADANAVSEFARSQNIRYLVIATRLSSRTLEDLSWLAEDRSLIFLAAPQPSSNRIDETTVGFYVSPEREGDAFAALLAERQFERVIVFFEGDYGVRAKGELAHRLAGTTVRVSEFTFEETQFAMPLLRGRPDQTAVVVLGGFSRVQALTRTLRKQSDKVQIFVTTHALKYMGLEGLKESSAQLPLPWPIVAHARESVAQGTFGETELSQDLSERSYVITASASAALWLDVHHKNAVVHELRRALFDAEFQDDPVSARFGRVTFESGATPHLRCSRLALLTEELLKSIK